MTATAMKTTAMKTTTVMTAMTGTTTVNGASTPAWAGGDHSARVRAPGRGGWWQELAGLVLPAECAGCGAGSVTLCPGCRQALGVGRAATRVRPSPEPPGLPPVYATASYGGPVRAALLAHKERGTLPLARPLGAALAAACRAHLTAWQAWQPPDPGAAPGPAGPGSAQRYDPAARRAAQRHGLPEARAAQPDGPSATHAARYGPGAAPPGTPPPACPWPPPRAPHLLLVPVPSARRAVAQRGHDAILRMARAAAAQLRREGRPARAAPLLRQVRRVHDQSGLTAPQRAANLAGALVVTRSRVPPVPVVVVDDLMTTGATIAAATHTLRRAGAWVLGAAVVAATERRAAR
jgi:predicted amidophosphoribosyltransferase